VRGREGRREGGKEGGRKGGRDEPMLAVHFLKLGQVDLVALGEERVETLREKEGEGRGKD